MVEKKIFYDKKNKYSRIYAASVIPSTLLDAILWIIYKFNPYLSIKG